jgi:hypothetical protein
VDVVVVVHHPISLQIGADPTGIIEKVRGVVIIASQILPIVLCVKSATRLVMLPYSVIIGSTTLTLWTTFLRCKLFLLLHNSSGP